MKRALLENEIRAALCRAIAVDAEGVELSWHFRQTPTGTVLEVVVLDIPDKPK